MLVKLHARALTPLGPVSGEPFIARITEDPTPGPESAANDVLLLRTAVTSLPPGFRAYLLCDAGHCKAAPDTYRLGEQMHYLATRDVVRIGPSRGSIHALYRHASASNTLLVTEQCDNYCLMCSQPPKPEDDGWIVGELKKAIPLISPDAKEIGLSGGEPALLGGRLVELVQLLGGCLPTTAVHILTNGRRFAAATFANALARIGHPDLMLGVPLYSDIAEEHDHVVQARGAYSETIRGILNLKRAGVRVELRCVVHAHTYRRLPELADFIARNLLFADHVALMGLEPMGFAKTNLGQLWVDPLDYQSELSAAVHTLDRAGVPVSIYNHQLCVLDAALHPFAAKSISDWKNAFFPECEGCARSAHCAGFFASSRIKRSRGIRPFAEPAPGAEVGVA
jgi:His-Xaa-Ser system radical SAM maturase HxsC